MKKMNNKGFSLVELIIVIAIMAILAGALAPALLRYIEKTRVSNDKSTIANVRTAVETALANEDAMEDLVAAMGTAKYTMYTIPVDSTTGADFSTLPADLKLEVEQTISPAKVKIKSKKDLKNDNIYISIALGGHGQAEVVEVYLQTSEGKYIDTQGVELSQAPTGAELLNNPGSSS